MLLMEYWFGAWLNLARHLPARRYTALGQNVEGQNAEVDNTSNGQNVESVLLFQIISILSVV